MNNHLINIDKYIYKEIRELLFQIVPEFRVYYDDVECGNYSFMNEFAMKLCDEIKKNGDSDFVQNSICYINILSESNNLEVINILKVGILEILFTSDIDVRNFMFKHLNKKNAEYFSEFKNFYH